MVMLTPYLQGRSASYRRFSLSSRPLIRYGVSTHFDPRRTASAMAARYHDITGRRVGRWTAIQSVHLNPRGGYLWLFRCDCGTTRICAINSVYGTNKSCGCLRRERNNGRTSTKHGACDTPVYRAWCAVRYRCENPKDKSWSNYGGRGITVCERWQTFENFYADMGDPPEGTSIDRKDNDGNYEPENCRWATAREQARNRRNNRLVTYGGVTQPIAVWAEQSNVPVRRVYKRLDAGWSLSRALTEPTHGVPPPPLWQGRIPE